MIVYVSLAPDTDWDSITGVENQTKCGNCRMVNSWNTNLENVKFIT